MTKKTGICLLAALFLAFLSFTARGQEQKSEDYTDTLFKVFQKKKVEEPGAAKPAPARPASGVKAPEKRIPRTAPRGPGSVHQKTEAPRALRVPPDQQLDPTRVNVVRSGSLSAHPRWFPLWFAACTAGDKIVVAWEDATNNVQTASGLAAFYNHSFRRLTHPGVYTENREISALGKKSYIKANLAVPFSDGKVLLAYTQETRNRGAQKGFFTLMGPDGQMLRRPTPFGEHTITEISATLLPGSRAALIAYHDFNGTRGWGRFIVVSHEGEILLGPAVFNNRGMTSHINAFTLEGGLIALVFECGYPYSVIIDPFGHVVREPKKIYHKSLGELAACQLEGGNLLVVCTRFGGKSYVLDFDGNVVKETGLNLGDNIRPHLTSLGDGNVFLTYLKRAPVEGSIYHLAAAGLDSSGSLVKGPRVMDTGELGVRVQQGCLSRALLPGDRLLVLYQLHNDKRYRDWESSPPMWVMLK